MKLCCKAGPKNKVCIRFTNKKIFSLPRKFPKAKCLAGPVKGFTMRSSCSPYKNCKK
jgi:hypothetical protein